MTICEYDRWQLIKNHSSILLTNKSTINHSSHRNSWFTTQKKGDPFQFANSHSLPVTHGSPSPSPSIPSLRWMMIYDSIYDDIEVSWNRVPMGTPKSSIHRGIFHYKPSIWGYPHFRKPPYVNLIHDNLVGGSATPLKNMKVNWDD